MNITAIILLVMLMVMALIIFDLYKATIKAGIATILFFIKSPVKAIKAVKAKRANRVKVDKKEMKLRKKARNEYFNNDYLMVDKFTNDPEVKAYLDMRTAKENLARHKHSVKNKNK